MQSFPAFLLLRGTEGHRLQTVVYFGNWAGPTGSCISRQGGGPPIQKLIRTIDQQAVVLLTDEWCTSSFCPVCINAAAALNESPTLKRCTPQGGEPYLHQDLPVAAPGQWDKMKRCRGQPGKRAEVLECNHCHVKLARDAVGCMNIRHKGMCQLRGIVGQPEPLLRPVRPRAVEQ